MVFHSISGRRRENSNNSETQSAMASSSTLKSHHLHNFQLHDLKWSINHTNNQRLRKLSDSSQKSPQSSDSESDSDSDSDSNGKGNTMYEAPNNGASSGSSLGPGTGKSGKKVITASGVVVDNNNYQKKATPADGRSKIYIRLRTKTQKSVDEVFDVGDQDLNVEYVDEFVPKTWNLRPRKPISKPPNHNGGAPKMVASTHENKTHRPESTRTRNVTEPKPAVKKEKEKEKKQKQKFSISLSREEIDDDLFAMTGSRASRRPKKRAKNVQKQLDCLFPGMWLASITPDSYKVPEPPLKG